MSLLTQDGFESFTLSLPAVTIVHQWGDSSVAKVGDKMFAMLSPGPAGLCFKVTEFTFDMLTDLEGVTQAPYLAKRGWVSVTGSAPLSDDDLRAYVMEAHRAIASKLTRKMRQELGLEPPSEKAPRKS
ncbi:MAG TPA: MmcQ/YjbR family DNA-binding protein [Devosiaceae bacterium]|jgi:predicted DNA-binding protein (MmcQ/YjbR family)